MRKDPVTEDELSRGEYVSWAIQGLIRNWAFLGIITVVTIIVWATNNPVALTWWNLGASYLALVIESIVGIAMFSQTKKDALVLRQVRTLSQRIEQIAEVVLKDVTTIEEELEEQQAKHDKTML